MCASAPLCSAARRARVLGPPEMLCTALAAETFPRRMQVRACILASKLGHAGS